MAGYFFAGVKELAAWPELSSDEHFSIDGALLDAWASHKSFLRKESEDHPPDDIRGYAISLKIRKRVEEVFGWIKTVGGMRKLMLIGCEKISGQFKFVAAIYNLVRIGSLTGWWSGSHT